MLAPLCWELSVRKPFGRGSPGSPLGGVPQLTEAGPVAEKKFRRCVLSYLLCVSKMMLLFSVIANALFKAKAVSSPFFFCALVSPAADVVVAALRAAGVPGVKLSPEGFAVLPVC